MRAIVLAVGALSLAALPGWAGNIVLDPDFSSPAPFPSGGAAYAGYGEVDGWTSSSSGNASGNTQAFGATFWDNGATPNGITSVGFLQVDDTYTTSSFSQVLNLDPGTVYDFSFAENARSINLYHSNANPYVAVLLDSAVLVAPTVVAAVDGTYDFNDPFITVSGSFTATADTQTLEFVATQQNPGDDAALVITDVDVESTPEPGTAGLMSLALAACCIAGFKLRHKLSWEMWVSNSQRCSVVGSYETRLHSRA